MKEMQSLAPLHKTDIKRTQSFYKMEEANKTFAFSRGSESLKAR